jgi:hypothetical protein
MSVRSGTVAAGGVAPATAQTANGLLAESMSLASWRNLPTASASMLVLYARTCLKAIRVIPSAQTIDYLTFPDFLLFFPALQKHAAIAQATRGSRQTLVQLPGSAGLHVMKV